VEETINKIRSVQKKMDEAQARGDKKAVLKLHDQKGELKKSLPAWLFCVSHIEKTERKPFGKPMMAAWRKAEQARLNGLVFLDIDGIDEPAKAFAKVVEAHKASPSGDGFEGESPSWCGDFCKQYGILFVHVTPSGKGLRFVFKADPERGNLADNQTWLSDVLGMKMDEVCKDSVRISFGCTRRDIIYIELENLLNYENKEFEKQFGEAYRKGNSQPLAHPQPPRGGETTPHQLPRGGEQEPAETPSPSGEDGWGVSYRGVPYKDIADAWLFSTLGHLPAVGERNSAYYALVQGCMRYICDFNEDMVVAATPDYGLSEQERRTCARSAIGSRRYAAMPRKLVEFLEGMGITQNASGEASGIRKGDDDASGLAQWDFEAWTKRFAPWFESPVWAPVCSVLPRYSRLNGILAAGSMFGTLLSGCRLQNWYDGSDLSLTYMTYIIGDAGTGKGDYRELDRLIMEPLRLEDARGRKAEENYQAEMKRLALAKAKKEDIPEEKHFPVRYLPTDTTLKQKLERCMDAINLFGTEQRQVACYNFESELSSKINYEKSSWNSSQDFDKKSFDCELTGSESRSAMTRNGLVPAFFNFVVTGTPDALQKKITLSNCLDGLPTRLIMGVQWGQKYQMLKRESRRRPEKDRDWLRTVGNRLLRCGWDVNLEQRVTVPKRWQSFLGKSTSFADALYYWGQQKAFALSLEDDRLGDYFRKRPPLIAVRLAAVDAIMNSLDTFEESGKLNLKFSSIELALNLADYIFESQLWFFGKLVEDALNGVPVQGGNKRSMKRIEAFNSLGENFTTNEVMNILNLVRASAHNLVSKWKKEGYVEKVSTNTYKKLVKIMLK
jgi:hypothetical protein